MSVVSRGDLIQALVSLAVMLLLMSAALFLSAGTLQWAHGGTGNYRLRYRSRRPITSVTSSFGTTPT